MKRGSGLSALARLIRAVRESAAIEAGGSPVKFDSNDLGTG